MPAQDTSKKAFEENWKSLGPKTQKIFDAMLDIGPTHNNRILEYLNQKELLKPRDQRLFWQINQITGRVNDLVHKYQIVRDLGAHRGMWHNKRKIYHIWLIIGDVRRPVGWEPVLKNEQPKTKKPFRERLFA